MNCYMILTKTPTDLGSQLLQIKAYMGEQIIFPPLLQAQMNTSQESLWRIMRSPEEIQHQKQMKYQ